MLMTMRDGLGMWVVVPAGAELLQKQSLIDALLRFLYFLYFISLCLHPAPSPFCTI